MYHIGMCVPNSFCVQWDKNRKVGHVKNRFITYYFFTTYRTVFSANNKKLMPNDCQPIHQGWKWNRLWLQPKSFISNGMRFFQPDCLWVHSNRCLLKAAGIRTNFFITFRLLYAFQPLGAFSQILITFVTFFSDFIQSLRISLKQSIDMYINRCLIKQ